MSRVHARIGTFDEKPVTLSEPPEAGDSPARRWNESEYCIDDETSLLQILSIAPGSYTVYSCPGQSFHGQPMPDRIRTYLDGAAVIDASFRIDEPSAARSAVPTLTAEMIAGGPPVTLDEPLKRTINVPDRTGATGSVVVHTQIGPDGKVVDAELCVATDRSLAARALELVGGDQNDALAHRRARPPPIRSRAGSDRDEAVRGGTALVGLVASKSRRTRVGRPRKGGYPARTSARCR